MTMSRYISRRVLNAALPALFLAALGYFVYHTVQGENGLLALSDIEARLVEAEREATLLADQRVALERRISLLRGTSLDPDMLDELARRELGYAHPLDVVIPAEQDSFKRN